MGMKAVASPNEAALIAQAVAQTLIDETIVEMSEEISQAAIILTNASGVASWTYPRPYTDPPVISADALPTSGQPFAIREISRSNTAVSLQVLQSSAVTILSISVLAALVNAGANVPVHIVAKRATPPA